MEDRNVDNMHYLYLATKDMNNETKTNFMSALVGSLSALVPHDVWKKGVDITRLVFECPDPKEILDKGKEILERVDI